LKYLITGPLSQNQKLSKIIKSHPMTDDERKASENSIIKFILRRISKNQFDRMNTMYDIEPIFESYDHFIEHNEKCVKNMSSNDLNFIMQLIERLNNILHSDSESFGNWESRGIYFDITDNLVIMRQ
jgi:hypothetical protein